MNVARLLEVFNASGHDIYTKPGGSTRRWPLMCSGVELLQMIEDARKEIRRIEYAIADMTRVVEGETAKELADRIDAENANPEGPARAAGWMQEKDLRLALEMQGIAFANWLNDQGTNIVKLTNIEHVRNLKSWPARHQYHGDYLQRAESWLDALTKARKEADEERKKAREEALS